MDSKLINYVGTAAIFFMSMLVSGCLEPFNANIPAKSVDILVVDGFINAGPGKTRIELSRVLPIQSNKSRHEKNAEVWIEDETDETFLFTETSEGVYQSDNLILPIERRYRLFIRRSNGNEYASDFQPVKVTPPIDSIHWEWRDQLYIYANSHDDQSATHYYTWTFEEDWQIRAQYAAEYRYAYDVSLGYDSLYPLSYVPVYPDSLYITHKACYSKAVYNKMLMGSTRNLTRDVISRLLTTIPAAAAKTQDKYRIIVRQRAMIEDEYNYATLANKNSELTGSFFDPMPSQLFGNIHRIDNPEELVIGYIGSYTTQSSELFIMSDELPPFTPQEHCDFVEFDYSRANLRANLSDPTVLLPYKTYYKDGFLQVIAVSAICIDCTLKSGYTSVEPDW